MFNNFLMKSFSNVNELEEENDKELYGHSSDGFGCDNVLENDEKNNMTPDEVSSSNKKLT